MPPPRVGTSSLIPPHPAPPQTHFLYQVLPLKTNLKLHVIRKPLSTDRRGKTQGPRPCACPARLRWPHGTCRLLHPVGGRGAGCAGAFPGLEPSRPATLHAELPARLAAAADLSHGAGSESRPLTATQSPPSKVRTPTAGPSLPHRLHSAVLHGSRLLEIFWKPEEEGYLHVHVCQACCLWRSSHTESPEIFSMGKGAK